MIANSIESCLKFLDLLNEVPGEERGMSGDFMYMQSCHWH